MYLTAVLGYLGLCRLFFGVLWVLGVRLLVHSEHVCRCTPQFRRLLRQLVAPTYPFTTGWSYERWGKFPIS